MGPLGVATSVQRPRLQLGMLPHALHVVDAGVGDLCFFQALHDIVGGQLIEHLSDDLGQVFAVSDAT